MQNGYVFGYGSLVNRRTHDHDGAVPARLRGWRRAWRHTTLRPLAFLTAEPDPGAEIDGLVACVAAAQWTALDAREGAYDRVRALDVFHGLAHRPEIQVYTIPHGKHAAATGACPVLLSYIDTVVQGFLAEFGEDGVAHFFATTAGWDAPIADDRARPIYRRHQSVSPAERALVDRHLAGLGCRLVPPPIP